MNLLYDAEIEEYSLRPNPLLARSLFYYWLARCEERGIRKSYDPRALLVLFSDELGSHPALLAHLTGDSPTATVQDMRARIFRRFAQRFLDWLRTQHPDTDYSVEYRDSETCPIGRFARTVGLQYRHLMMLEHVGVIDEPRTYGALLARTEETLA